MSTKKVWIVTHDREVKQVDSKKIVDYKHTPKDMGKLVTRKGSARTEEKWEYVYFGATREEACLKANHWRLAKIAGLEKELAYEKAALIV